MPDEMSKSVFIPLSKKSGTLLCEEHRTISLMSHLTKILLKVLMRRNKSKIEAELSDTQFGFRPDCGTRNAVFTLKNVCQRAIEMTNDIYLCFVDYTKAFDRIVHNELIHLLDDLNLDDKDLRLIQSLYYDQAAVIRVRNETSHSVEIERGVRQGCVLSPDLFSVYSEVLINALEDLNGVSVGGVNINNLRYADDTVLMAKSEEDLQKLVNRLDQISREFGMEINIKKTEVMTVSKRTVKPDCKIFLNGRQLKQVDFFKYLGCIIADDCRDLKELNSRIGQAKSAFMKLKNILINKNLSFKCRHRVLKCYVYAILTYCSETWTITKQLEERIEAFEMWCFRRMQRISWKALKTNSEVLAQTGTSRDLLKSIRTRQLRFLGHVIRKRKLEHLALTGKIDGRRSKGRQRNVYLQQFRASPIDVLRIANNRKAWKEFSKVAINVWNRHDT